MRTQLAIAAVLIGAALLIVFVAGYSLGSNRVEQPGSPAPSYAMHPTS